MRVLKRVFSGTSAAVLALSSVMSVGISIVAPSIAHAAGGPTCEWDPAGSGDHASFNDAGNWQDYQTSGGCSNAGLPAPGDYLLFDTTSLTANKTLNNNMIGLSVGGLIFDGTNTSYYQYTIGGNAITVSGNITSSTQYASGFVTADVSLGSDATILSGGSGEVSLNNLDLNGHNLTIGEGTNFISAQIEGTLTGNGDVSVANKGNFTLTKASASWQGDVTVASSGYFEADGGDANALGASANTVTVASGGVLGIYGMNGGTLPQDITVGGTGGSGSPGALQTGNWGTTSGNLTLSGTVTLTADTVVHADSMLTLSGPLHGSFDLTSAVGMQGSLVVNSSDNQSNTKNGTYEAPVTTNTDSDNLPNQYVGVGKNVTEIVDGQRGYTFVDNGGLLEGTGQVSDIYVSKGGTVAPGHSPGKLTVLNTLTLANGAIYQAQLKDTTAGDFDQLVVGKSSDTTGNDVTLGDTNGNPTLNVELYDGYKMKAGDQFRIIDNLSGTAVKGTFNNLPEGATFSGPNSSVFKISYTAGDGNDVVLTVVTAPKTPDTGFGLVAAHPGATLGLTILAAGTIFAIARTNRKPAPARARANSKRR